MSRFYKRKYSNNNEFFETMSKAETKARQFIKRQLINSKGNTCAICGEPITNMKDCSIDHIIPVSKGGLTTIENCQLAHTWCNTARGNATFCSTSGEK